MFFLKQLIDPLTSIVTFATVDKMMARKRESVRPKQPSKQVKKKQETKYVQLDQAQEKNQCQH